MTTHPDVRVVSFTGSRKVEEAIRMVSDSEYGLQVGVFTRDINVAWEFIRKVKASCSISIHG